MGNASFDIVARFYDYENEGYNKDISFYLEYAKRCGGDVLELGCGTGRILIPLARAGIKITGLDISEEMLKRAQKKISQLEKSSQANVEVVHGDMRSFKFSKRFSLIFSAFRSFQSLLNKEEQDSCLEHAYQHLEENGFFILDLFAPRHDILAKVNRTIYMGKFYDQENDVYVYRWAEDFYDLAMQTLREDRFYEWTDNDGQFHLEVWSFELAYLFRYEMELLLEKHGFKKIEDVFGDFDKSPYNYYSGEQIFVARKR
ncbi:MAG: class I SAM-dependent methyltransferase [bacterium]